MHTCQSTVDRDRDAGLAEGGGEGRAMAVALVLTPFVPVGIPVLCAALVAVVVGWRSER